MSERALKVLVCGGRDFNDAMTLGSWLGGIHKKQGIGLLIHGGARGADFMAGKFAEWARIPVKEYPADWQKHGRAAGPIRNQQMLDEGKPDLVVSKQCLPSIVRAWPRKCRVPFSIRAWPASGVRQEPSRAARKARSQETAMPVSPW